MKYLFSRAGRAALKAAMQTQLLLAFDFDGTLAPIVKRPDDAKVSAALSLRIERLARLRPVAVVTGRSVADVSRRLGVRPTYIVGNHGAESEGEEPAFDLRPLAAVRQRVGLHAEELRRAGIEVEDKGYSIAFHYRLARDQRSAPARLQAIFDDIGPSLRMFFGKCVLNVVLADAPDKGNAVESLVRRSGCHGAIFVGDDVNDEPVFERATPTWLTVRVGREERASRAAFFISGHAEIIGLLDDMLRLLEAR